MRRQEDSHVFAGMQQDMAASKQSPQYLIDAHNIRFTVNQGNTLLSITNEKGPASTGVGLYGVYLGHCVLNNYIVVFTTQEDPDLHKNIDTIYRIEIGEDSITTKTLYESDSDDFNGKDPLNFSVDHPIKTLGYFETEKVQKVYWVDGINQPRVINIVSDDATIQRFNANSFQFVQDLKLQERVSVEKINSLQGIFAPGPIQYAFSYYSMYGQESNIFYTTPLMYTSYSDRAGSEQDKCSCVFKITISNIDPQFDYLRVYSIQRTSLDATPIAKIVTDIEIQGSSEVSVVDNGMGGETIDPQQLLYVGGEEIAASSICQKDNTLFLGNIELLRSPIKWNDDDKTILRGMSITSSTRRVDLYVVSDIPYPNYTSLHSTEAGNASGFKHDEYYRLGLQFQHRTGKWSQPVYLKDVQQKAYPSIQRDVETNFIPILHMPVFEIPATEYTAAFRGIIEKAKSEGYVRLRPVVVCPREEERTIICQGIANPTMFTNRERFGRTPEDNELNLTPQENIYAWASWFFRPMNESGSCYYDRYTGGTSPQSRGTLQIPSNHTLLSPADTGYRDYGEGRGFEMFAVKDKDRLYNIDWNMLTLNAPDLDMWDYFYNTQLDNCDIYNVGSIHIDKTLSDIQIFTDTPTVALGGGGFTRYQFAGNYACGLISGPFYNDGFVNDYWESDYFPWYGVSQWTDVPGEGEASTEDFTAEPTYAKRNTFYNVYLWQKEGSLNNDVSRVTASGETKGVQTALLKNKIVSNLRISYDTFYATPNTISRMYKMNKQGDPIYYRQEYDTVQKINNHMYYGNVDTLIAGDTYFGNYILTVPYSVKTNDVDGSEEDLIDGKNITNSSAELPLNIKIEPVPYTEEFTIEDADPCTLPAHAYWGAIMANPYVANNADNSKSSSAWLSYGRYKSNGKMWVLSDYQENEAYSDLDYGEYHHGSYGWIGMEYKPIGGIFGLVAKKNTTRIKYLSSPHIVFQLAGNSKLCLPHQDWVEDPNSEPGNIEYIANQGKRFPKNDNYDQQYVQGDQLFLLPDLCHTYMSPTQSFLPIVELRRPYDSTVMFGGQTDYALMQNKWIPAGDPVLLENVLTVIQNIEDIRAYNENLEDLGEAEPIYDPKQIVWKYGDTWYQRYDCLKTRPYSESDTNQLVEILSCMLETHVNLDGRWDRNRGLLSNLTINRENFNRLNEAYSQLDNFFTYQILPNEVMNATEFKNQFTWSLEKHPAEQIDQWTNVNLGSTYDLDGSLGQIVDIVSSNNQLYAFQDSGISNILFNSRVQIPTSDGVPIEITNNYKVEGAEYISTTIGCRNSAAICQAHHGIYFLDSRGGELQFLTDKKIENISLQKGITLWFRRQQNRQCTPSHYSTKVFYDKQDQDLYIVSPDESLVYSEKLQAFTSFMSYSEIPAFFNVRNNFLSFNQTPEMKEYLKLYKMFAGEYNNFFGEQYGYDITFVSNGLSEKQNASSLSKVFANIDLRGDLWENGFTYDSQYLRYTPPFKTMRVFNEYQDTYEVPLTTKVSPSNAKEKFRIWRFDIPRNKKQADTKRSGIMDRIRNPWCKIKLSNASPERDKMQLHDINVSYFI